MKKSNRFLAVLLTLAMVFSMLPAGALAADPSSPLPKVEETAPTETPKAETPTETPAAPETPKAETPTETPAAPVSPQSAGARATSVCKLSGSSVSADNKDYTSFDDAFTAAGHDTDGGCTITLTANCENRVGQTIAAAKPLTIEGDGFTLTLADNVFFNVTGNLTINNIKMTAAGNNDFFHVKDAKTLALTKCDFTAKNPTNGIFNLANGLVVMNSGTLKADGVITNGGNGLSLKTGTGADAVDITGGTIQLNKDKFITLLDGSTAPTKPFNIKTADTAAANDKIVACATADIATALADKIIVNGNAGWSAAASGSDIVLKPVRYVLANATSGDGSLANPYATIGKAYTALTNGGEIRLLSDLTAAAATIFDTASKTVTLTSCKADGTAWAAAGDTRTVKRGAGFTSDSVLKVSNGTVTLDHITLDGNAQWDHADRLTTRQATNTTAYQFIQITGGELVLDGGATVQNHARVTGTDSVGDKGGAIYLTGSTAKLTMNTGAKLLNNYSGGTSTAGDGGAVSIWDGALFTMNDGTISGNTANRMGGAVRVSSTLNNKGQFVLNGGSITGNALIKPGADQGGGVSVSGGTLAIASVQNATPIVIKDNTLKDGTLSNVRAVVNGLELGDMSGKTSDIGITADANTVFATSALNTDLPYFHSDNLAYGVVLEGTTLKLVTLPANVYVANSNTGEGCTTAGVDTNAGTAAAPFLTLGHAYDWVAPGGTIHVMDDLDPVSATIAFDMDKTITLESCKTDGSVWGVDADTHTIKRNTGFVDAMLDITAGNVTMKHLVLDGVKGTVDATAPLVGVGAGTSLTLGDGATIQNNKNTTTSGLGGGVNVAGTLTMSSGSKITENTLTGTGSTYGGGVYVANAATFQMNGGTISNNIVTASGGSGGGIMVAPAATTATVRIGGDALITGNSCGANGAAIHGGAAGSTIAISGTATITGNQITGATFVGGAVYPHFSTITAAGGVKITSNTNNEDKPSNLYLKTGTTLKLSGALTSGANIGVYSAATPTPGHPVQVATGANATDATYFTSDNLVGAGIRAAKSGDPDNTGIYLDVAEKMKAQIIKTDTSKVLYKTFDDAIKAITEDSGNLLVNSVSNDYKIELLADCTTNGAFTAKTIAMQSISGQKYTLMVNNFITTTGGNFTATDIKFADATTQHEWLQAYSPWTFTGCELPNFAVVGVTVTLNAGTVVNGNIRVDNRAASQLSMKAGAVEVTGEIQFNNAAGKVTLLSGSNATKHYNVRYASNIDLGSNKIVMDGTTNSALADVAASGSVAKNVSIFGGNAATKEWVAIGSDKNVITKVAKSYWVSAVAHGAESAAGDDTNGDGTYLKPYKTIAKAYTAGAAEVGLDIRVLSDLPTTAATTFANADITSVKISSYKSENAVADKPWTITRKDIPNPLLTVTKGAVNLTNITLDGNKSAVDATAALVSVGTGTSLTLSDGATIQNNKNTTTSGLGGGVNVAGTLTMNSGSTITGNTLTGGGSTYGGGVYVANAATFQMNGGTISNNTVNSDGGSGGGIMVAPAATTATVRIGGDALITGNSCGANGAAIHGGGVDSTITISGNAKITGNRITAPTGYVGAAVYPNGGSLVLSGDVQITGNSNQNGSACNVYLPIGKTLTIGGAHMGAGSAVGVYCQTMPSTAGATVNIATNAVETDKGHFFSDKSSEAGIKFDGDKVVLAYDARYIPEPVYPEPDRPDPNVTVEPGPGKVTTRPKNPDPGTKVTVTIEPETGWEVDKVIIVTVPGGEPVVVTGTDPITYIAPDPNTVKITVKYKRIPVDPRKNGVSKLLEADKHIAYFVGDGSGKFNPEKGITRAETAQIFYNLLKNKNVEQTVSFRDVEAKAWYAQAVNTLASLKIIEGRGHNYFDPMAYISRAEFTAIAMRFADSIKGTFTYTDVPADYWAESAISGAAQYGWIVGYADGSFKPMENIKRAEAAKIVNTMLWRFPDTKFIDKAEGLKTFPDLAKGNWAYYDVVEATNAHEFAQTKTGAETWKK